MEALGHKLATHHPVIEPVSEIRVRNGAQVSLMVLHLASIFFLDLTVLESSSENSTHIGRVEWRRPVHPSLPHSSRLAKTHGRR